MGQYYDCSYCGHVYDCLQHDSCPECRRRGAPPQGGSSTAPPKAQRGEKRVLDHSMLVLPGKYAFVCVSGDVAVVRTFQTLAEVEAFEARSATPKGL